MKKRPLPSPAAAQVYVHKNTPELYRITYSKPGVPHVVAQRSFNAPLSPAGILTARISPVLEQTAEFAVVQITAPTHGFIDEVYLDARKMEKWVASPTGQPYAALFYLKAPTITSSSRVSIYAEEKNDLDKMVHVGLLLLRNVSDGDIFPPYSNVAGVRVDNGLANVLNPLEYDGPYDLLCGTLIMASPVSQAYASTDPDSIPARCGARSPWIKPVWATPPCHAFRRSGATGRRLVGGRQQYLGGCRGADLRGPRHGNRDPLPRRRTRTSGAGG